MSSSSCRGTLSQAEQDAWDAPLVALAQKSGGDLRLLLHAFFSFLSRRTDFYMVFPEEDVVAATPGPGKRMGFREGDAEKLLLAAFRQFPLRRMPKKKRMEQFEDQRQGQQGKMSAGSKSVILGDGTKQDNIAKKTSSANDIEDISYEAISNEDEKGGTLAEGGLMKEVRWTEEGKQIPVGNGGCTARYHWTQTLDETTVILPLPEGTRGKDLDVSIRPTSISVSFKGKSEVILEGGLAEKVRTDECTWSMEGGALLLTLDKLKKTWWETVITGDPVIDTSLVDSTRKLADYDEVTQGAIRKIMFDQRQKRLGLPTSDEMLGKMPVVPPLPSGVEYIDSETLDRASLQGKQD